MMWHLRCLWSGIRWVFPGLFFVFSVGQAIYLGALALNAFARDEAFPIDKAVFPAIIVVILLVRVLHEVGENRLLEGGR